MNGASARLVYPRLVHVLQSFRDTSSVSLIQLFIPVMTVTVNATDIRPRTGPSMVGYKNEVPNTHWSVHQLLQH